MESFVTLIIVVIVFNLISGLMRAAKGGQGARGQKTGATPPTPPSSGQQRLQSWVADLEALVAAERNIDRPRQVGIAEPDLELIENDQAWDEDERWANQETKTEIRRPIIGELVKSDQPNQITKVGRPRRIKGRGLSNGLRKALTERDPLVSAFIFHEVFSPPAAKRHR